MFECTAIPLIPEIPDEIIEAVNSNNLIIFVGAGVSNIAGLPSWKELADRLFEKCKDLTYIDNQQYDITKTKVTDSKQLITIAYELHRKNGNIPAFHAEMTNQLTQKEKDIEPAALDVFDFCKFANAMVLTTNADLLLDGYFEQSLTFDDIDNQEWLSNAAFLVKLHGTIKNPQTLVFTSSQYLERYSNSSFQYFLRGVFSSGKTVLFIGYGLSEFELLEYMISPFGSRQDNMASKLFVLKPYFSYEEPYKDNMDLYFENMHIRQIPYSKDKNGYNQLADVLKYWKAEINSKSSLNAQRFKQLADIVESDNPDSSTVARALHVISESLSAEQFFFNHLQKTENASQWIVALGSSVLFDPAQRLHPAIKRITTNQKTILDAEEWFGLRFIFNYLSKKSVNKIDPAALKIIKTIIANTVLDFCNNKEKMTNDHAVILCAHMLFLFDSNICGEYLFTFFDLISEYNQDFGSSIYGIVSSDSNFGLWNKEDKLNTIKIIVKQIFYDSKSMDYYYFDEITKKYMNSICAESAVEMLSFLLDQISSIESGDSFAFSDIGSIHHLRKEEADYHFSKADLIVWCKSCVESARNNNIEDIDAVFKQIVKTETIEKVYIFYISTCFSEKKDEFFSQTVNPFDSNYLYEDLFYLIERNNSDILPKECDLLLHWIENSDFGCKPSSEYAKALKYDLLFLLSKSHPYVDPSMYYSENHDKYSAIGNCSKRKYIFTNCGEYDKEILANISTLGPDGVIQFLRNVRPNNRYDLDDYADALYLDIKNRPSIYYGNLQRLAGLPIEYFQDVIRAIDETAENENLQEIIEVYRLIAEKVQQTSIDNYIILRQILDSLNRLIVCKKSVPHYRGVYSLTADIMSKTRKTFETVSIDEGDYYETIGAVINVWYCVAVTMMLRLA